MDALRPPESFEVNQTDMSDGASSEQEQGPGGEYGHTKFGEAGSLASKKSFASTFIQALWAGLKTKTVGVNLLIFSAEISVLMLLLVGFAVAVCLAVFYFNSGQNTAEALKLYEDGRFNDANSKLEKAPSTIDWFYVLAPLELQRAKSRAVQARVLQALGRYFESRSLYTKALASLSLKLSPKDQFLIDTKAGQASLFKDIGLYSVAANEYRMLIPILQTDEVRYRESLGEVFRELGEVQRYQVDFDGSEASLMKALTYQKGHPMEVSVTNRALGILYRDQSAFKLSEARLLRALTVQNKIAKPQHPESLWTREALGVLYMQWGRPDFAKAQLQKALSLLTDRRSPLAAEIYRELGNVNRAELDFNDAARMYAEAISIQTSNKDVNRLSFAQTLINQGELFAEEGDLSAAEQNFLRAKHEIEASGLPRHPQIAFLLRSIGNLRFQTSKWNDAERYFRKALSIQQKTIAINPLSIAKTKHALGRVMEKKKRFKEAIGWFEDALGTKNLREDDPAVIPILLSVADSYTQVGKPCKALQFYQQAVETQALTPSVKIANIALLLDRIESLERKCAPKRQRRKR